MGAGESREMSTVMAPRPATGSGAVVHHANPPLGVSAGKETRENPGGTVLNGVKSLHKVDPRV